MQHFGKNGGNQSGVAHIVVLWIFIFLFVVAFDFSMSVREEATAAQRYSDETQGYYLALAGIERGLYDFLHQQPAGAPQASEPKKNDLFDGTWQEETFGGGNFRVRLIDEGARPAAILMDVQMPGLSGVEATQALRTRPAPASAIPVLGLSANDLPASRDKALAAGMDGYLTKPLQPELLRSELGRVLRLHPEGDPLDLATTTSAEI